MKKENNILKNEVRKPQKDRFVIKIISSIRKRIKLELPYINENELNKMLLIIAFYRLVKLNILSFETIKSIYYYINDVAEKERAYASFSIWRQLILQQLYFDNIISYKQLENLLPHAKNEKLRMISKDFYYWIVYDVEHNIKNRTVNLLDETKLKALYQIADNLDIDEFYADVYYDTVVDLDEEDLGVEITNLITRLNIRELRNQGIIAEVEETALMSQLIERNLTYIFFNEKEIKRWKAKAGIKPLFALNKGE